MKTLLSGATMALFLGLAAFPAAAGVVYDNSCGGTGCANGLDGAGWNITNGFDVSDSFTISAVTNLTSVDLWIWDFAGETMTALDWSIGTTEGGNDVASGSGTATSDVFLLENTDGFFVYRDSFNLSVANLAPGTYYLTLQNGVVTSGDSAYWDQSDGASTAFQDGNSLEGCGFGQSASCSESFDIVANGAAPEPGTVTMLAGGVLMMAGLLRRRLVR